MIKAKKFIRDYTNGCSNELCAVEDKFGKKVISFHEWLTPEQALAAVEIAVEETIDNVCDYLRDNIDKDLTIYNNCTWCKRDDFIQKLKEAMTK